MLGCKVILKTFNGTQDVPAEATRKLIGSRGTVVKDPFVCQKYAGGEDERKVLVRFEDPKVIAGLNANEVTEGGLWVLVSDLEVTEEHDFNQKESEDQEEIK